MNLKNKILSIALLVILALNLTSCAKCISTEYENVEVVITDEYYSPMWMQVKPVMMTHPAVYKITVQHDGNEYTIDDADTYNKYNDKVGQTAIGQLETKTYDNGTVTYDIVSLE